MDRGHAILVLGMHRSGTSALTRTIALCGSGLPATLFPAVPGDNDAGYWESSRVIDFHQWLLWHLGTGMLDPAIPNPRWYASPDADDVARRLAALVAEEWGEHPTWVIKEPRLCRLLPLWRRVLEQCGRSVVAVHCLREPGEVAASLARRDTFPRRMAELLWFEHVAMAERDTRDLPRTFLAYDDLLADWRGTLERVARLLPIGTLRLDAAAPSVAGFLDPALRRHRGDHEAPRDEHVRAIRDELFAAARGHREPDRTRLDLAWEAVVPTLTPGAHRH